jgi:hypothetical protein
MDSLDFRSIVKNLSCGNLALPWGVNMAEEERRIHEPSVILASAAVGASLAPSTPGTLEGPPTVVPLQSSHPPAGRRAVSGCIQVGALRFVNIVATGTIYLVSLLSRKYPCFLLMLHLMDLLILIHVSG